MEEADRPDRTTKNRTINLFSKCIDNKRMSDKYYSKHTGVTSITPLTVASPAGRLAHFTQIREKITEDQLILSTVKGYRIEFHTMPYQAYEPHPLRFNQEQQLLVEQEVNKLQDKGAVTLMKGSPQGRFISTLFLVPKKGWWSETSHQPEMPECICGVLTLQNGRHTDLQEPCETRGLVSEGGPKGHLFFPSRSIRITKNTMYLHIQFLNSPVEFES